MDFDGVMTDDRVFVNQDGIEMVVASRGDGLGLAQLRQETDLKMLVISTEANGVVRRRCEKLGLPCANGVARKEVVLAKWLSDNGLDPSECAYIGNDVNDLAAMEMAGWTAVPSDVMRRWWSTPTSSSHTPEVVVR